MRVVRFLRLVGAVLGAVALPTSAIAQSTDTPKLLTGESVVRVKAEGRVERMPDYLGISVTVSSRAPTPQQVSAQNRSKLEKLASDLSALGVSEGQVRAEGFEATPVYENRDGYPDRSRIIGYEARQSLTVDLKDLSRLQPLLLRLSELGYSDLRAAFRLRDEREAQLAAQRDAIAKAREEAGNIAASLRKRVSRLLLVANDPQGYRGWETVGSDIIVTGSRIQPLELKPAPIKVESTVFVDWSLVDR